MNSKLLQEAIADAKAVKATAIANAKAALEEAFAPRVQELLSKKLEEEEMEEMYAQCDKEGNQTPAADLGSTGPNLTEEDELEDIEMSDDEMSDDEMSDDDIEMSDDEMSDEPSVDLSVSGPVNVTVDGTPVNGDSLEDEMSDDDIEMSDDDEMSDDEMSDDEMSDDEMSDDDIEMSDDELELESIIKELEDDSDALYEEEPPATPSTTDIDPLGGEAEFMDKASHKYSQNVTDDSIPLDEEDEDIDINEILAELDEELHSDKQFNTEDPQGPSNEMNHGQSKDDQDVTAILAELDNLRKENKEYHEAITYLRGKLNEVNLLNAKLLYTTKLFRNNALTNEQKVKVVEAIDLTKSVREVKLVFATLAESFSFGVAKSKKKNSITEGLASKVVPSTKPTVKTQRKVMNEGSDVANRFQKLAGIKKLNG